MALGVVKQPSTDLTDTKFVEEKGVEAYTQGMYADSQGKFKWNSNGAYYPFTNLEEWSDTKFVSNDVSYENEEIWKMDSNIIEADKLSVNF